MAEPAQVQLYSMVPLLQAAEARSLSGNAAAVGAYNVNFWAQAEGILKGLYNAGAPGIIQASKGANKFQGGPNIIYDIVMDAMGVLGYDNLPVALHLDHGNREASKDCLAKGFSSVMIDLSSLGETKNIRGTRGIVRIAHAKGKSVEAEYGLLVGVEEDVSHEKSVYADPLFVPVFLDRSGADALAIAYGTSHGANKGNTDALDISVVKRSYAMLTAAGMNHYKFLVSHGSSQVPAAFVAQIEKYGGKLPDAQGVPDYMIIRAIANGMRKINIDTDLRLAMTGQVRQWLAKNSSAKHSSPLVKMMSDKLDGTVEATEKGQVIAHTAVVDPRSWLDTIKEERPDVLRKDYREADDEAFTEVMTLVSNTVANHVTHLSAKVFGGEGLEAEVDRTMTQDKMKEVYKRMVA